MRVVEGVDTLLQLTGLIARLCLVNREGQAGGDSTKSA
jgi:hypothetical protein